MTETIDKAEAERHRAKMAKRKAVQDSPLAGTAEFCIVDQAFQPDVRVVGQAFQPDVRVRVVGQAFQPDVSLERLNYTCPVLGRRADRGERAEERSWRTYFGWTN